MFPVPAALFGRIPFGQVAQLTFNFGKTAKGSRQPREEYMIYTRIIKPQIIADQSNDGAQYCGDIAGLTGAGFVVSWTQNFGAVYNPRTMARIFDADGTPIAAEFQVNTFAGSVLNSSLQALDDGGFAALYENGKYIAGQRFDATGAKIGAEFLLSGANDTRRENPTVTLLNNGTLAVVFDGDVIVRDGCDNGVAAQIIDTSGQLVGPELIVDEGQFQTKYAADILALKDGGFATLSSWARFDPPPDKVSIRIYNADGTARTDALVLDSDLCNYQKPAGTQLADGRIIVVWDNGPDGIDMRTISPTGKFWGQSTAVVRFAEVYGNKLADVVALPDGGFFVAWSGNSTTTSEHTFGQRCDANKSKVGDMLTIDPDGQLTNEFVNLSLAKNGDILVSWEEGTSVLNLSTRVQILEGSYVGTQSDDTLTDTVGTNLMFGRDGDDALAGKGAMTAYSAKMAMTGPWGARAMIASTAIRAMTICSGNRARTGCGAAAGVTSCGAAVAMTR
ncbi:MAG: hypothetical protein ACI8R4_001412 [Paracoccaceae bacterium]